MALDPNIALGVRPIQLDMPNPLAQYGQIAAIQNAQNQNQLAQFQLGAAQRADLSATAQNELYAKHFDPTKGGVNVNAFVTEAAQRGQGGIIPGFLKTEAERKAAAATLKKTEGEIAKNEYDLQQKKYNKAWQSAGAAATPEIAIGQITKAVRNGEIDMATGTREIRNLQKMPPEEYRNWRANKILELMDAKDQLSYILPKVTRQDTGGVITSFQDNPMMEGYGKPIAGMNIGKTMTPGEMAADARAKQLLAQNATGVVYQEDSQGNVIALPSKLKAGEVPVARIAVAPGGGFQPLMGKLSESVAKEQISINQQRAIVKGAIDAVTKTPDAFGMTRGLMGETLGGRMGSSEENEARSYLFNVVSGVIKERAGTAQSASEAETLARFLPQPTDDADVIKDKMTAFDKYLVAKESGTTKQRGGASTPGALGTGTWKVVR